MLIIVVVCRCLNWVRQFDLISLEKAYVAFSDTMRAGPQARGFQVSTSWIPPSPVPKVGDAFSNKGLRSGSSRQPVTVLGVITFPLLSYLSKVFC